MEIKPIIEKLEASDEYVRWKKHNKETYLTHALNIMDGQSFGDWQLGYFNKKSNKITVFELGDRISISPESEVFKKEETAVKPLDKKKIKVDLKKVLDTANTLVQKKYPQILAQKIVIILQNLELGQVWNLTYISKSFEVLNIKISSEKGNVLSHDLKPLFEFRSTKKS